MKIIKKYLAAFILLSILTTFSSCNGQGNTDHPQAQLKPKTISSKAKELDPAATVLYQDKKENFWFGSKEKGIYKFDGKNLVLFTSHDGLSNYSVLSVQEDNDGNLYFDTPDGVYKYDGQKFTTLTVIESDTSKNEWKSQPNDLWFRMGWTHSGPFRYDGKNLYHLEFPKNKMEDEFYKKYPNVSYNPYGIYCLFKDSKDNIWLGTSNLGIYLFDGKEISWMYENQLTETPNGGSFGIRSIAEDREGNYWICNANYKYTLLPNDKEGSGLKSVNFKRQIGIENKENLYFLSILTGKSGDMWMLTYEQGLWRNNGKALKQLFIKDHGIDISPTSMYKDNQGDLWFGTDKYGIYKYNGNAFEKFKLKYKSSH